LEHNLMTTPANARDVTQAQNVLHGQETDVFADSGYRGVRGSEEAKELSVNWHIAMMPGKRRALNLKRASGPLINVAEKVKAGKRAKLRYRGLAKSTPRLHTLFALSNL
jgi:IS5 family transposase